MDCPARFTIVEATTKAGKTVGCIVWLFEQSISDYGSFYVDPDGKLQSTTERLLNKEGYYYWWVAPTHAVAKIAFRRFKRYINPKEIFTANESELSITLVNGAMIFFKSGDNPDSLYGEDVYAVVLDEATRMKEDSWTAVFTTLTATSGACKIIGNVKGINNWVYKLAREAERGKKENWAYFKITADDAVRAGVLRQSVIDEARRTLPEGVFLELYYGIPFVNSSNKFCYSFNEKKHVGKCEVDYKYPIYLSFDFNANPISCNVIQWYNNHIYVPYVIKLENSNIYRLCETIKTRFIVPGQPQPTFIVNGDASGNAKSGLVQDHLTYFRIIKAQLNLGRGSMQQLASNPRLQDNQVLVNAVLEHVGVTIDSDNAQPLIFDMKFVEMDAAGKIKKADRNDPTQQSDALDGFRYFINRNLSYLTKGLR